LGGLWLNVINAHFGLFAFMVRHSQIVAIEFGHQNSRLGSKCARNPGEQGVVIRVLLLKNFKELVTAS